MIVILGVWAAAMAVCARMLIRNQRVYQERRRVLRLVSALAERDIREGRFDWNWRYREFEKVSYDSMMWSLRPVRSFFADSPALKDREAS